MEIDGVELKVGDRVLIQNNFQRPPWYHWRRLSWRFWKKSTSDQNGIYIVTASTWQRLDVDDSDEMR